MRLALFLVIPIYARFLFGSSILAVLGHVYAFVTTSICIANFAGEFVSIRDVWDIIYGFLMCSHLTWIPPAHLPSLVKLLWVGSTVDGWKWEFIYWMCVAKRLTYLLPEAYGNDVTVRVC